MHADCTFANLGGAGVGDGCLDCTGGINAANASVNVVNSTFFDPAPFNGTSYVRAWGGAHVLLSGCEFAPTPELKLSPFYARNRSFVYSSDRSFRIRSDSGPPAPPSPIAAIPDLTGSDEAFLQGSDPWFQDIQQVSLSLDRTPLALIEPITRASSALPLAAL